MVNKVELGSEFDIDINKLNKVENNLFNYLNAFNCNWYDSGRTAIRHIPIDNSKKILLPEYICESVINCFNLGNIIFYEIDELFNVNEQDIISKIDENVGTVYICHYFGFCQDVSLLSRVKQKCKEYGIDIIEDTTQSIFSVNNFVGEYIVASVRKWMAVPQGGVLYSERDVSLPPMNSIEKSDKNQKIYGMVLKNLYLYDGIDVNEEYRKIFSDYEATLDEQFGIYKLSDMADFIISCNDVNLIMQKRKSNAKYVQDHLEKQGINIIRKFDEAECPLVVPIRVKNRDDFRNYLIDNRIYCAVHWPFDEIKKNERLNAEKYSKELISIPIDQRYSKDNLDYMLDVIGNYGGELLF